MVTPVELWNQYPSNKRAVIGWFYDFDVTQTGLSDQLITQTGLSDFDVTRYREITFPDLECVYFPYIDRGVKSWKRFVPALKSWFPSLKTLLIYQNYTYDEQEEFHDFMCDDWLDHIWIENLSPHASEYNIVTPHKIRIFHMDDTPDGEPGIMDADTFNVDSWGCRHCALGEFGRLGCDCDVKKEEPYIIILSDQLTKDEDYAMIELLNRELINEEIERRALRCASSVPFCVHSNDKE